MLIIRVLPKHSKSSINEIQLLRQTNLATTVKD